MSTLRLALLCVLAIATATAAAMGPLHEAAAKGDTQFVRDWITKKRNLDVTYDDPVRPVEGNYARTLGVTALMVAAHFGQLDVAKRLVEAGADLYVESHWPDGAHRRNAFDYAVEGKQLEVARYLWSKGGGMRLGARLPKHMCGACSPRCDERLRSQTDMALFLVGIAPDEAVLGKDIGNAVCRLALMPGGIEFLEKHLARVPRSSLHCVAYGLYDGLPIAQRSAVASWLLDHGADPNDRSARWTPLMGAAFSHDMDMVKLLLARGGDLNVRGAGGETAISLAADSCAHGANNPHLLRQVAMVEYLAGAGSDKNVYASAEARSKLGLLPRCCAQPESAEQRRICAVFGL